MKLKSYIKKIGIGLVAVCLASTLFAGSSLAFNFSLSTENPDETTKLTVPLQSELEAGEESVITTEQGILDEIGDETGLRDFGDATGRNVVRKPGLQLITGALMQIINIMKWGIGTIGMLYLVYTGISLITATDKASEVYEDSKRSIQYLLIGFVSVFAIDIFVNNVFILDSGNFLGSVEEAQSAAQAGSTELRALYNIAELFMGVVAVLILVYHGVRMVGNAGDEEVVTKAKNAIPWALGGLMLVGVAEFVVKDIFFVNNGEGISINNASKLIVDFTNFASGFVATASILAAIYAGYLYIASGPGEDQTEQAKKIIIGAVIGIILASGAFAVANTFIRFDESAELPDGIQTEINDALSR